MTTPLLKQKSDMLVPIAPAEFAVYRSAARILKQRVGTKAPDTVSLIQFELTGRNPQDIVGCFLDHLRDVERRRRIKPGVVNAGHRQVPTDPCRN